MLSETQAQLAAEGALERLERERGSFHRAREVPRPKEPAIPTRLEEFKGSIATRRGLEVDEVRHEGRLTAEAIRKLGRRPGLGRGNLEIVGDHRELDPIAVVWRWNRWRTPSRQPGERFAPRPRQLRISAAPVVGKRLLSC